MQQRISAGWQKDVWSFSRRWSPLRVGFCLAALTLATIAPNASADDASSDRSRVVAIGGSVTEILYALGLEQNIAAVDTTSVYPPAALATHPNVGYMRALSAEGVLSVSPSLIIAEGDAGPKETLEVLRKASVPLVQVPDDPTPAGLTAKIHTIGAAMQAKDKADALATAVAHDLGQIEVATTKIDKPVSALFVLSMSGGRLIAAGKGTAAHGVIKLAGGRNAFGDVSGYKPASPEAVLDAEPDVIITMNRGDHAATIDELIAHPALAMTPAARNRRVAIMEGLYLLGFGPRTAYAVRDLAQLLYPDLDLPELQSRAWMGDLPPVQTGTQ